KEIGNNRGIEVARADDDQVRLNQRLVRFDENNTWRIEKNILDSQVPVVFGNINIRFSDDDPSVFQGGAQVTFTVSGHRKHSPLALEQVCRLAQSALITARDCLEGHEEKVAETMVF